MVKEKPGTDLAHRAHCHSSIRIPAEWEPHSSCWMAWAVHREWGNQINQVKAELANVIRTISRYEPVRVLTPTSQLADARARFSGKNIEVVEAPVDDIWMRDIAPTFALCGNGRKQAVVAIDWNFNAWGATRARLRRSGDNLAKIASAVFGVPRISVPFVAEGGALATDGRGTLITTRSCLLNPNRNPITKSKDRQQTIERVFRRLGMRRVIWLEGDPCEPITSGHADGYLLFTPRDGVLVEAHEGKAIESPMWRQHDIALLESTENADGRKLRIKQVKAPRGRYRKGGSWTFAPCYLNAYLANNAVITARFGDSERDNAAKKAFATAFPGREVTMLRIDTIANGGGGIHCLTQPMPATDGAPGA